MSSEEVIAIIFCCRELVCICIVIVFCLFLVCWLCVQ